MRQLLIALAITPPVMAGAQTAEPESQAPPLPFLEEWADRTEDMMRELMDDFGPGMEALMSEVLPRLKDLSDRLGGISNYELPEVLPNGDIIIRRKEDAPPLPPDMNADNNPIDL